MLHSVQIKTSIKQSNKTQGIEFMLLQDAKGILKDAKVRVCRHHPRLVLTGSELKVYEQVRQGINNAYAISYALGLGVNPTRLLLSKMFKEGYLTRHRQKSNGLNSQYHYSITAWVPNDKNK